MRIRTIKPEFWLHEGLCGCAEFSRLLAIALLNWADDEGYFMANPVLIRGQVFPFLDDSKMIPRSLQELSRVGWIRLGKDNSGRDVGCVTNFSKHQRVDKPKPSEIKGSSTFQDDSKMIPRLILDGSKEEGNGREGNGTGKGKGMDVGEKSADASSTSDEDWLKSLSDDPAYSGISITAEFGKMSRWCEVNRKQPSRRRFINWLNRAEKPLNGSGAASHQRAPRYQAYDAARATEGMTAEEIGTF